jgi:heat shock protein HslJ
MQSVSMKNYFITLVLLFATISINTGCKSRSGKKDSATSSTKQVIEKTAEANSPVGKHWKLVELRGVKVEYVNGQTREMYMTLKEGDNILVGHGGCNTFSGKFTIKAPVSISFREIISTEMACPNMNNEAAFLQVLQQTDNYSMNGDTLFLHKAKMAPLARFEAVYMK